jgi:hypothetical protein
LFFIFVFYFCFLFLFFIFVFLEVLNFIKKNEIHYHLFNIKQITMASHPRITALVGGDGDVVTFFRDTSIPLKIEVNSPSAHITIAVRALAECRVLLQQQLQEIEIEISSLRDFPGDQARMEQLEQERASLTTRIRTLLNAMTELYLM